MQSARKVKKPSCRNAFVECRVELFFVTLIGLIPLALRGVRYRAVPAATLLRDNMLVYGVGGVIAPFIGIKLIDMVLVALGLV